MSFQRSKSGIALVSATALFLLGGRAAQPQKPASFNIAISLPAKEIHVGDPVVVDTVTSNPSDHVVYGGEGPGGYGMELLDAKGKDIGRHAMGNFKEGQDDPPVLSNRRETIRPGDTRNITFRWKPDAGYVTPGVYKLRVYRHDVGANVEIYSNTVVLTVVP